MPRTGRTRGLKSQAAPAYRCKTSAGSSFRPRRQPATVGAQAVVQLGGWCQAVWVAARTLATADPGCGAKRDRLTARAIPCGIPCCEAYPFLSARAAEAVARFLPCSPLSTGRSVGAERGIPDHARGSARFRFAGVCRHGCRQWSL